jgi:hypothetical protein
MGYFPRLEAPMVADLATPIAQGLEGRRRRKLEDIEIARKDRQEGRLERESKSTLADRLAKAEQAKQKEERKRVESAMEQAGKTARTFILDNYPVNGTPEEKEAVKFEAATLYGNALTELDIEPGMTTAAVKKSLGAMTDERILKEMGITEDTKIKTDQLTITNQETGETKRVYPEKGVDYSPPEGWVIGKVSKGMEITTNPDGTTTVRMGGGVKPPSGYRTTEGGNLEPIPGGPAARQSPEQAAKTQMIETAISSGKQFRDLIYTEPPTADKPGTIDRALIATMAGNVPFTEGRTANVLIKDSIEAKLRAESGAAVPEPEVKRASERFKPSIFDKDETIELKTQLLDRFLRGALDKIDPTGAFSVKDTIDSIESELIKIEAQQLPQGIPEGSKQVGTYQGKPVYQTTEGKRLVVD